MMLFDWMSLNNAFHGIFRRATLDEVMPCTEIRGFDINLMAEVSLYGKFVEVFEPLFYRRYEPDSTGSLLEHENQVSFFGAGNTVFGPWQRTIRQLDKFAMRFRTPISWSEKMRIELDLLVRLMWLVPAIAHRLARIVLLRR